MEHAPLRPLPSGPSGPVDASAAGVVVQTALPGLDERAARAFALVALAGRTRPEAALRLQVSEEQIASDLAAARKALRRSVVPLRGSGWCQRADRLVSDRLDGELDATGAARLDVHLRNCSRCVEHERRLVHATDTLLAGGASPPVAEQVEPAPIVQPAPPPAAPAQRPTRSGRELARATTWNVLLAIAVLITLAAIAVALAGVLGVEL